MSINLEIDRDGILGGWRLDRAHTIEHNCILKALPDDSIHLIIGECPVNIENYFDECYRVMSSEGYFLVRSELPGRPYRDEWPRRLHKSNFHILHEIETTNFRDNPPHDCFLVASKNENACDSSWPNSIIYPMVPRAKVVGLAQRDIETYIDLIKLFTIPGQIVLDICCGTGGVGVAAVRYGRYFLGCDINFKQVAIANARIKEEVEIYG